MIFVISLDCCVALTISPTMAHHLQPLPFDDTPVLPSHALHVAEMLLHWMRENQLATDSQVETVFACCDTDYLLSFLRPRGVKDWRLSLLEISALFSVNKWPPSLVGMNAEWREMHTDSQMLWMRSFA